jgi:hypothetical protein
MKNESITIQELKDTLIKAKNSTAPREDEINSELYKYTGEVFLHRLLKFF